MNQINGNRITLTVSTMRNVKRGFYRESVRGLTFLRERLNLFTFNSITRRRRRLINPTSRRPHLFIPPTFKNWGPVLMCLILPNIRNRIGVVRPLNRRIKKRRLNGKASGLFTEKNGRDRQSDTRRVPAGPVTIGPRRRVKGNLGRGTLNHLDLI